jgi:histidyl-tRNA synthetase
MAYADKIGVPYAVLLGDDEIAAGKCSVKDMRSGVQQLLTAREVADLILENLSNNGPIILEK